MMNYILSGHEPVPESNILVWAKWFEMADRKVSRTELGDLEVSTIFLGIDHSFGDGPPVLFETMVFQRTENGRETYGNIQERYCAWDEAEAGHARIVKSLSTAR